MEIVSRDWVFEQKQFRRQKIEQLEYHAHGDCIHLGKISKGCSECFLRSSQTSFAIYTGCECNVACGYCYYDKNRTDATWNTASKIRNNLADLYALILTPNLDLKAVTYNSWGETLSYLPVIREAANTVRRWEQENNRKVYNHLYTNGILADETTLSLLKDWGIIELRFHPSASFFSDGVLKNMKKAAEMGFIVSVEEPSLPENKTRLIEKLPYFESIGIKHLNLVECQVTSDNKKYLDKTYPKGRIYRDHLWHMYDEGMVYDVMEEVIKNKYSFSMIDCNSRVEGCRASNQISLIPELVDWDMMKGACL